MLYTFLLSTYFHFAAVKSCAYDIQPSEESAYKSETIKTKTDSIPAEPSNQSSPKTEVDEKQEVIKTKVEANEEIAKTKVDPNQDSAKTKVEAEEEVDIDLSDPDVSKAALMIQSGFRGRLARKQVLQNKVSAWKEVLVSVLLSKQFRLSQNK